jgi:RNA-directed DNA polymerase
MNTSLSRTRNRPWGLLEPDAWKAGSSGSEGAGAQQCAPATRGFRIQRHRKRGSTRRHLYTYPSKAALAAIKTKVRTATREGKNEPLAILLGRLNPVLRGWTNYFRHGVSKATFNYLRAFVWRRVVCWLRHKHPTMTWKELRQRYLAGWWPAQGETVLVDPARVHVTRYRYRGDRIPSPWTWAERMQPTDV